MAYELCTLVTVDYLPRALVLHRSLTERCAEFRLRAFCMDARSKELLGALALANVQVIAIEELESHDPALAAVKPERTAVEYCWTATPAACLYALEREPDLETITCIDADMMFFSDPHPLYEELGDDSVLIVPHRFPPDRARWAELYGTYNSQLVAFRRDERGLDALRWWHERCLEWCHDREEPGRYGDQKYLDDWPERFPGVHVLRHPGGGVGPWNAGARRLAQRDGAVTVDGEPLIFYHYQSLRLHRGIGLLRRIGLGRSRFGLVRAPVWLVWSVNPDYEVPARERELLWAPYVRLLAEEIERLRALDPAFDPGLVDSNAVDFLLREAREALPPPVRQALRRARGALATPPASRS